MKLGHVRAKIASEAGAKIAREWPPGNKGSKSHGHQCRQGLVGQLGHEWGQGKQGDLATKETRPLEVGP